jgi:cell division protein FtsB
VVNYYKNMPRKQNIMGIIDILRDSWFLLAFIAGLIYWVARQDSSLSEIERQEQRITALENRTTILESGIGQLQLKIDGIKEDVTLIKSAVIKN